MSPFSPETHVPARPILPLLMLVGTMSFTIDAQAQHTLPLLRADIDLEAYGIDSPAEVGRGQLSIVYGRDGVELVTYYLRTDPIRPRVELPPPPAYPTPLDEVVATRETALWVWNTAEILADRHERTRFLDFIAGQGITKVFLYLPPAEGERAYRGFIPFDGAVMGPLLADLHARGAGAYALDGDRYYVLEENHEGVFRTVGNLVEYNRSAPPEERFHGVRYDIEPYLVPGFQAGRRAELLDGYVRLIAGASEIAREGGLAMAVDVPLWFDAPNEETGEEMLATLDGETAPVLEHVMKYVDDLAIMDYRTSALGPNGAVVHAMGELALGEEMGVDVYVGVETVDLPDEDLVTFFGPSDDGLPPHAETRWVVLEESASGEARVWIVEGEDALTQLSRKTEGARMLRHWAAGRPSRIAADALTFYDLGAEKMREVTDEIVRYLATSPAFVGLAYHEYRTMRELLEGR